MLPYRCCPNLPIRGADGDVVLVLAMIKLFRMFRIVPTKMTAVLDALGFPTGHVWPETGFDLLSNNLCSAVCSDVPERPKNMERGRR